VLPSSKSDAKQEARFAARIDVLTERVDTLSATVATTASAIAKKDGEIASLRRDLQARDEALQALAARAGAAGPTIEPRIVQELQQTVAALAGERRQQGSSKQLDELNAKVALIGQRLETVSTTVSTTAAGLSGREGELAAIRKRLEAPAPVQAAIAADPSLKRQLDELASGALGTKMRLDGQAAELDALTAEVERRAAEPQPPSDELRAMLTTLRARVEALSGIRAGITEDELDARLVETGDALGALSRRIDTLAETVETATASLAGKEHELAALHGQFTESSTRIETVVEDIREALSAFPETGHAAVEALSARVDRMSAGMTSLTSRMERRENASREASDSRERSAGELAARLDALDQRVATISTEVRRAKTLWPVALRSLEARLDDAVSRTHDDEQTAPDSPVAPATPDDDSDDLLADLRESLQAMETVAEEMERASESRAPTEPAPEPAAQEAVAGGARIVPLRASDP
jgi:DNA repair exonuclease SbcCD ATPase subunit